MRAEVENAFLIAAQCYQEVEKHDEVARLLLDHVLEAVLTEGDGMPNLGTIRELLSWLDLSHVVPERLELVQLFKHHLAHLSDHGPTSTRFMHQRLGNAAWKHHTQ